MALIRKNILKIALVLFLLGGIIFFSESGPVKFLRGETLKIFLPFFKSVRSASLFSPLNGEQAVLEEKDLRIRGLEFDLQKKERENLALKSILNLREENNVPIKGANVTLYAKEAGREFILIDQGAMQGVRMGELVVDEKYNLVGAVVEVEDAYAKVDIASNAGKTFEVEITRLNIRALAEGIGSRTFALKLVPRDIQIVRGDFVSLAAVQYRASLLGEIVDESSGGGGAFWNAKVVSYARPEFAKTVFLIASPLIK